MESVSSVRTMLGIVHDILAAVETASQNKSRCKKVANRVRCIKDILEASAAPQDKTASTAAMDRLEEALSSALQVVRQCQRSSFLGSVVVVVAGGRSMAESLDEVERDIDRCILDLTLANSLRLETLVVRRQHNDDMAAANNIEDNISQKDDENNRKNKGKSVLTDKMVDDPENNTTTTTAIGVPVYMMTSAVVHEIVSPPPSYAYYCSCGSYHSYDYWRNHGCRDNDGDAGGPSNDASLYRTQYSWYHTSMFSDDDPNSCSIM